MAKQLLKERFQQLAGIKPLYENEDRKADHSSFEYDENQNDGDLPIPTAGQWADGTEMTEDELDDYYQKMEKKSKGEMHSIMLNNLDEAKDVNQKYYKLLNVLKDEGHLHRYGVTRLQTEFGLKEKEAQEIYNQYKEDGEEEDK